MLISDLSESALPRQPVEGLGENDHDLLTFDEAGERLQTEIARAVELVAELSAERAGDNRLMQAQHRLAALQQAERRMNTQRFDDANFERFFGYPRTAEHGTGAAPTD